MNCAYFQLDDPNYRLFHWKKWESAITIHEKDVSPGKGSFARVWLMTVFILLVCDIDTSSPLQNDTVKRRSGEAVLLADGPMQQF